MSKPGAGFDVDTNEVTLVTASEAEPVGLGPKSAIASAILDRVETLLASRPAASRT